MHLSQRAYVLIMLTAILAIAGIWSSDPAFLDLWRFPAVLLLIGLTIEGLFIRRAVVTAGVETAARALLGREQAAWFAFHNATTRPIAVEYAPVVPEGIDSLGAETRMLVAQPDDVSRD